MNTMNKWMEDFTKSIILSEVLRRLDKYGVSPWTIEKTLCGVASAKTLYNYMNGETKPRAQVYTSLFKGFKEKYSKLFNLVIEEISEEYGNKTFSEVLQEIEATEGARHVAEVLTEIL